MYFHKSQFEVRPFLCSSYKSNLAHYKSRYSKDKVVWMNQMVRGPYLRQSLKILPNCSPNFILLKM